MSIQSGQNKSLATLRRLARLAAVQGLYQAELSPEPLEAVIQRFHEDPSVLFSEEQAGASIDTELLMVILSGTKEHRDIVDTSLSETLGPTHSLARLEELLKAILRAGAFEILYCLDTPEGIIVNDYVDVAHSFFAAKEPAMVNAVLDALAKKKRQPL
ncbi:MAG: transcription antitermination factor NusB [Alphaproteobacteria bacterium]|nr:transcription antitermination factor NusB [Alphaproteobacteria bacterium]